MAPVLHMGEAAGEAAGEAGRCAPHGGKERRSLEQEEGGEVHMLEVKRTGGVGDLLIICSLHQAASISVSHSSHRGLSSRLSVGSSRADTHRRGGRD